MKKDKLQEITDLMTKRKTEGVIVRSQAFQGFPQEYSLEAGLSQVEYSIVLRSSVYCPPTQTEDRITFKLLDTSDSDDVVIKISEISDVFPLQAAKNLRKLKEKFTSLASEVKQITYGETCSWKSDLNNKWREIEYREYNYITSCNNTWKLKEEREESGFIHCPSCGRKII